MSSNIRHAQSDRSAQGDRAGDRPHRRSAQDHGGTAPYQRLATARSSPTKPMAMWSARTSPGLHHVHRSERRRDGARRAGDRHGGERRQARQRRLQHRQTARPESSTITKPSRSSLPKASNRHAHPRGKLIRVNFAPANGAFDLAAAKISAIKHEPSFGGPADTASGGFAGAFAKAPVQFDATYTMPDQSHAMMEPHASIAAWNGDQALHLDVRPGRSTGAHDRHGEDTRHREGESSSDFAIHRRRFRRQIVYLRRRCSRHSARAPRRPVKVALPRPLIINNTTHRPATIQRIHRSDQKGKITAIGHEAGRVICQRRSRDCGWADASAVRRR